MPSNNLQTFMLFERRKAFAKQMKKHRPKPPKQIYPASVEREYVRELNAFIAYMYKMVKDILFPALPGLTAEVNSVQPIRADDFADSLNELMGIISLGIDRGNNVDLKAMALNIGQKTFAWNNRQWQKVIKRVMGADTISYAPWIQSSLNSFSIDNVALIKSLKEKSLTSIQTLTSNAIRSGVRHEVIAKQIQSQFKSTKKQAKLIARDQVAKLNSQLAMLRQQDLGLNEYIWRTSGDDRVRSSHAALNGKKCRWDNPNVFWNGKRWVSRDSIGGINKHPGQDYQCRCWAEPVFDAIYNAIDTETPVRKDFNEHHDPKTGQFSSGGGSTGMVSDVPASSSPYSMSEALDEYQKGIWNSEVGGAAGINNYLRTGSTRIYGNDVSESKLKDYVSTLDNNMETLPAMTVYRGVHNLTTVTNISTLSVGTIIQDKGYSSTTKQSSLASTRFATKMNGGEVPALLVISSGKSFKGIDIGNHKKSNKEKEVILPRNTKLKVDKVTKGVVLKLHLSIVD